MKHIIVVVFFFTTGLCLAPSLLADVTLHGNGGVLSLNSTSTLEVAPGSVVTLKDLTLKNLSGSRLIMGSRASKLVLDNCRIVLDSSYAFTQGALEVRKNSSIEGGGYTFSFEGQHILIDEDSQLHLRPNLTFNFTTNGSDEKALVFANKNSKLLLDSATFKDGLGFGRLWFNGAVVVDGLSTIDSANSTTDKAIKLGGSATADGDCSLRVRSGAKLLVRGAGIIIRNKAQEALNDSGGRGRIEVRRGSHFIIERDEAFVLESDMNLSSSIRFDVIGTSSVDLDNNTVGFDTPVLSGKTSSFFVPTGIGSQLQSESSSNMISDIGDDDPIALSARRRYLATILSGAGAGVYTINELDGTLTFTAALTNPSGADVDSQIAISPDERFIAQATDDGSNTLRLYRFNAIASPSVVEIASFSFGSLTPGALAWSPDGRHLATLHTGSGSNLRVYKIDENGVSLEEGNQKTFDTSLARRGLAWSPDGKYLLAGNTSTAMLIFAFDSSVLSSSPVFTSNVTSVFGADWSPDGVHVAIGAGSDARMYTFDRAARTLTPLSNTVALSSCFRFFFAPSGNVLAFSGGSSSGVVSLLGFDGATLSTIASTATEDIRSMVITDRLFYITRINTSDPIAHHVFTGSTFGVELVLSNGEVNVRQDINVSDVALRLG